MPVRNRAPPDLTNACTPRAPTAVVADDERLMRDQIVGRLKEAWPELAIVGQAVNGREAVAMVRSLEPDIVFLDIRMPEMDGIEAAQALAGQVHVVFVTAHDEYAVRAFEQGAVDYVLKPADSRARGVDLPAAARAAEAGAGSDERTAGAAIAAVRRPMALKPRESMRWVQASVGTTIRMIPTSDILFFRAEDKYTRVQTAALRRADPQADQGADRRARPEGVLADPPRHRRARRCDRAGDAGTCAAIRSCT